MNEPDSVKLKIERAKVHLQSLAAAARVYYASGAYSLKAVDNDVTERREVIVDVRSPPPPFGLILGDVVHNLRSSLDHLICELVRANRGVVTTNTMFPIAKREADWKSVRNNRAKGVTRAVMDALDDLAPYPGRNDPLCRLHRLDIADKHELLLVVAAASPSITLDVASFFRSAGGPALSAFDNLPGVTVNAAEPTLIEDGAVVFAGPLGDESIDSTKINIELRLIEGTSINARSVDDVVAEMIVAVEDAVERLRSA